MARWDLHLRRGGVWRTVEGAVRFLEVHLRIERLVRLQIIPVRRMKRLHRRCEIPVRLA